MLNEQEATTILQAYDGLPADQQAAAKAKLQAYRDNAKFEGYDPYPTSTANKAKAEAQYESLFDDLKNVDALNPTLAAVAPMMIDADAERAKEVNRQFLSRRYGKPVDELRDDVTYQLHRDAYAQEQWADYGAQDDKGFYQSAKIQTAREKTVRETQAWAQSDGFLAAAMGDAGGIKRMAEWKAQAESKPGWDSGHSKVWLDSYQHLDAIIAPHRPLIANTIAAMSKTMEGLTDDPEAEKTLAATREALIDMPGEQRRAVIAALVTAGAKRGEASGKADIPDFLRELGKTMGAQQWGGESGDATGAAGSLVVQAGEALGRMAGQATSGRQLHAQALGTVPEKGLATTTLGIIDTPSKARQFVSEHVSRAFTDRLAQTQDNPYPVATEGTERELTPEESRLIIEAKARSKRAINISREIQDIAESTDPIKSVVASTAGTSIGIMAPLALGGPMMAVPMAAVYQEIEYEDLSRKYPDMAEGQKSMIASISAPIQAALDLVELGALKRLPSLNDFITKGITRSLVGGVAAQAAKSYGVENAVELVQDFSTPLIQDLAHALKADVPDTDWDMEAKNFWLGRLDVAIGMIPLTLIGLGYSSAQGYQRGKSALEVNQNLGEMGFPHADRVTIADAFASGDNALAQRAIQEAFPRRSPEIAAEFGNEARASRLAMQQAIVQAQERGMLPRWRRDGEGFSVRVGNDSIRVDSMEQVQAISMGHLNEWEKQQQAAVATVAGELLDRGTTAEAWESAPSEDRKLRDEAAQDGNLDSVLQAARVAAQLEGVAHDDATALERSVVGSNRAEMVEAVRTLVSRGFQQASVLTPVEEFLEGRVKLGLSNGTFTAPQLTGWVRSTEAATGLSFLGDEASFTARSEGEQQRLVLESISKIVVADVLGQDSSGKHFAAGTISRGLKAQARGYSQRINDAKADLNAKEAGKFRHFLRLFRTMIGAALKTAKAIALARKDGKLGEDHDAFVDKLLGANAEQRFASEVELQTKAMLGEETSENGSYSLGVGEAQNFTSFSLSSPELRAKIEDAPDVTTLGALGITEGFHANDGGLLSPSFEPRVSRQSRGGKTVGFYMAPDAAGTEKYGGTLHTIPLAPDTRVAVLRRPGQVERITPEQRDAYRADGIHVLVGPAIIGARIEIAVLDPQGLGQDAFADSRAKPANTSNITEMPDGAQLVGPTTFPISEYGGNHRPNSEGPRAFDLAEGGVSPADVYEHPEWYSAMDAKIIRETMAQLRKVKGRPDGEVNIYRAGPKGEMNEGDWVSLSKEYARTHAESQDPEGFKVWVSKVKAQDLRWAMDDLAEFGYFGKSVPAEDSGVSFSISAYHGTPHKVDKFSTSKIGTGEGAQAYGWGLYFAESRAVGEDYRKSLSAKVRTIERSLFGEVFTPGSPEYHAGTLLATSNQTLASVKNEVKGWINNAREGENVEHYKRTLATLNRATKKSDFKEVNRTEKGNLYTVELLPDEDDFLDWDKPLSGQKNPKLDALKKQHRAFLQDPAQRISDKGKNGDSLYHMVTRQKGSEKAASEYLASLGIPGIRYLDGNSRDGGKGTSNYVIFDESLVKILEENGKAVEDEKEQISGENSPDNGMVNMPENDVQARKEELQKELGFEATTYNLMGLHGAWISSNGEVVKVNNTYGHADVIEPLAKVKIKTPEDYEQAYAKGFVRLTNTPGGVYATYGTKALSGKHKAALEMVAIETGKTVYRDTGAKVVKLYEFKGEASYSLSPADRLGLAAQTMAQTLDARHDGTRKFLEKAHDGLKALRQRWADMPARIAKGDLDKYQARMVEVRRDELEAASLNGEESVLDVERDVGNILAMPEMAKFTEHPLAIALRTSRSARKRYYAWRLKPEAAWRRIQIERGENVGGEYDGSAGPSMWFQGEETPDQLAEELHSNLPQYVKGTHADDLWNAISAMFAEVSGNRELLAKAQERLKAAKARVKAEAEFEGNAWRYEQDQIQARLGSPRQAAVRDVAMLEVFANALPPEVRGKLRLGLAGIAEISSDKAFVKELTQRARAIDKALNEHWKHVNGESLADLLKRGMGKAEPGKKRKGNATAAVHEYFGWVSAAVGLTEVEVMGQIAAAETSRAEAEDRGEDETPWVMRRQVLEEWGNFKGLHVADQSALLNDGWKIFKDGRWEWGIKEMARLRENRERSGDLVDQVGQGTYDKLTVGQKAARIAGGIDYALRDFEGVLSGLLGREHALTKRWASEVSKGFAAKEDALAALQKRWEGALRLAMPNIKGLTARRQRLYDMRNTPTIKLEIMEEKDDPRQTREERDYFTSTGGEVELIRVVVTLTEGQALNITLAARQTKYIAALERAGWNEEALAVLERGLSPEAKILREWMSKEMKGNFPPLSKMMEEIRGMKMPQIPNYWPGRFYHAGQEKVMDVIGGGTVNAGFADGFSRERKDHVAKIKPMDAFEVFWQHMNDTNHWLALAPIVREMRGTTRHPMVKTAIEGAWGKAGVGLIEQWMQAIEGNGLQSPGTVLDKAARASMSLLALGKLSLNIYTIVKQAPAMMQVAFDTDFKGFVRGAGEAAWNPSRFLDIYNSPVIQRRLNAGYSPEVRMLLGEFWHSKPGSLKLLIEKGMNVLGYADALFTTLGAAASYEHHAREGEKAGMSSNEAHLHGLEMMTRSIERTAQPQTADRRSMFEHTTGGAGAMLTMFMGPGRQLSSIWIEPLHNLMGDFLRWRKGDAKRKASARDVRNVMIAHLVLAPFMQVLASAIKDWRDGPDDPDDDPAWEFSDFATAILLGPMQGIPLIGQLFGAAQDIVAGRHIFEHGSNTMTAPVVAASAGIADLLTDLTDGKTQTIEQEINKVVKIASGIGGTAGAAATVFKELEDVVDQATGKKSKR